MILHRKPSDFEKRLIEKIRNIPAWVLSLVAAMLPVLITWIIIYWGFGAKLSDYRPYYWNDQTGYWMWIRSFSEYGLNVGFNVGNELTAPATFNHFGEGSPVYIYLYGMIGRLIHWSPQLPILINFFVLALAIFWFTRAMKLNSSQVVWTGLVILLFWPILLYLPTSSHETLNQAIGIILAGNFYRLLSGAGSLKPYRKWGFIVFLFFASLVRLSWALFFFPLIFLSLEGKWIRKGVLSFLIGSCLLILSVLVTKYLVPPWGNSIFSTLEQTFETGPQLFLNYFGKQLSQLWNRENYPSLIVVLELLIMIGWSLARIWRGRKGNPARGTDFLPQSIFNLFNACSILLGGFFVYLVPGFFRVFIPPLLVAVLLHILYKDFKPVLVLLGINLMFLTPVLGVYGGWEGNFRGNFPQLAQSQATLDELVSYDSTTENAWCNTLILPLYNYDYRVTIIPAGIGVSHLSNLPPLPVYPLKSKYILLDNDIYELLQDKLNVELLASLPIGDLYYNLDSGCTIK